MKRMTGISGQVLLGALVCCATLRAQSPGTANGNRAVENRTGGNRTDQTRTIGGVVISGVNGEPLEDAGVTLLDVRDGKLVAETGTDLEGRFLFANLPDGRFELRALHRGFVTADFEDHQGFSTAIVTGGALDTTGLRFTLEPQAAIYGTVTEDSGDPVPNARVSLYSRIGGSGKIVRAGITGADVMGHFEFPHLAPGNYYLCAAGEPWYRTNRPPAPNQQGNAAAERPRSPLDVAYRLSFFPDGTDSNAAEAIEVNAGDRVVANFTLHPVPAVHISVPMPDFDSEGGARGVQFSETVFGTPEIVQTGSASIVESHDSGGNSVKTMEIYGVPPGEYEVEVSTPSQTGGSRPFTTIDATSEHASLDISSVPSLAEVSGKVSMASGASLPDGLSVALASGQDEGQGVAQVKPDGSFQFGAVRPGKYRVLLRANDLFLSATRLNASGGNTDGHELEVGNDPVTLTVVSTEANATVSGFANLNGKPAPGVFVVLVPADSSAGREALLADQTDSDGSFIWFHVLPGAYTLVAVKEGWTLDWSQPGAMTRYLAKGEKVNVPADAKLIELKEPVEVQSKEMQSK
jgi:5-hydroxyisourate hydrolase-like protein (transthyretin family)